MILNTGGRTDMVNYFSEWLLNRFREGYVLSRNPFHHEITDRFNCPFHYTITAYGKDVEPGVPPIDESIEALKELSAQVGKEKIIWRYDPVLLTDKYTIAYHFQTFDYMAERLAPYLDRCLFSFVVWYKKLALNMPELLPISEEQKNVIARGLGDIAAKHKLYIQTCATKIRYSYDLYWN